MGVDRGIEKFGVIQGGGLGSVGQCWTPVVSLPSIGGHATLREPWHGAGLGTGDLAMNAPSLLARGAILLSLARPPSPISSRTPR